MATHGDKGSHRERIDALAARVDKQDQLLQSTARLSLQSSHRLQSESAKRTLVCFIKEDLRLTCLERYQTWQSNAKKPPAERPVPPPPPLREQIGTVLARYLLDKVEMVEDLPKDTAGNAAMLSKSLEAVNFLPEKGADSEVLVPMLVFRPSETALLVREQLLLPCWSPFCGKQHPIGFRPARLQYSASHRNVMEQLGLPLPQKGQGKGRRSPKRETEGGASPVSTRRRT